MLQRDIPQLLISQHFNADLNRRLVNKNPRKSLEIKNKQTKPNKQKKKNPPQQNQTTTKKATFTLHLPGRFKH